MTTFWCKSNPFNDDHVDVDEKQPNLYHDPNDSETGTVKLDFKELFGHHKKVP